MTRISRSWVIKAHGQLIEMFGGSHGIRDEGALDSALSSPFQTFNGNDLYPTLYQKTARLGYGLMNNHPFIDGNKRIGAFVMEAFLNLNGVELEFQQQELIDLILKTASGESDCEALCKWIQQHEK